MLLRKVKKVIKISLYKGYPCINLVVEPYFWNFS